MNLKIERGILLKPYAAPYTRKNGGGHKTRAGWTPERTPAMQARFDKLRVEQPDAPDYFLWQSVANDEAKRLARLKRPWPGWFPIGPATDRKISKAYRELFLSMNPDNNGRSPKAQYPPDGDYIFERGAMRLVELAASVVDNAIDDVVKGMVE